MSTAAKHIDPCFFWLLSLACHHSLISQISFWYMLLTLLVSEASILLVASPREFTQASFCDYGGSQRLTFPVCHCWYRGWIQNNRWVQTEGETDWELKSQPLVNQRLWQFKTLFLNPLLLEAMIRVSKQRAQCLKYAAVRGLTRQGCKLHAFFL